MNYGTLGIQPLLILATLAVCGADCFAQSIGQRIPDGKQVEVHRNGQTRRGVVNGYMTGEYRVQYGESLLDYEWVPEADLVVVAPLAMQPKELDLAPLYQALGAAMCPIALIVLAILYALGAFNRKPPPPRIPPVRYPPQAG